MTGFVPGYEASHIVHLMQILMQIVDLYDLGLLERRMGEVAQYEVIRRHVCHDVSTDHGEDNGTMALAHSLAD